MIFLNFSEKKNRVLYNRFWAFPGGPGGFRELREAYRNHFHLSWYLLVPGITSYSQKRSWGIFFNRPRYVCIGMSFLKQLGRDAMIECVRLKHRILHVV